MRGIFISRSCIVQSRLIRRFTFPPHSFPIFPFGAVLSTTLRFVVIFWLRFRGVFVWSALVVLTVHLPLLAQFQGRYACGLAATAATTTLATRGELECRIERNSWGQLGDRFLFPLGDLLRIEQLTNAMARWAWLMPWNVRDKKMRTLKIGTSRRRRRSASSVAYQCMCWSTCTKSWCEF